MPLKAQGNVVCTYNSQNITAYMNTASLQAAVNELDTTNLAGSGATKIAGVGNWTDEVGGLWDEALDDIIGPDAVAPPATLRTFVVTIATVVYTWTSNSFLSNYQIQASEAMGLITWSATLSLSGAPVRS